MRLNSGCSAPTSEPSGPNAVARLPKAFAQALHFARSPGRGLVAECNSSSAKSGSGGGMEQTMSEVTLFGFPRSTYVQIAGLVLTQKEVPYTFHDGGLTVAS